MGAILRIFEVLGGNKVLGGAIPSSFDLDDAVDRGLPFAAFERVCAKIGLGAAMVVDTLRPFQRVPFFAGSAHRMICFS